MKEMMELILWEYLLDLLIIFRICYILINLNVEVAINKSPMIPIVILVANGKIPKNIKTTEVKAKRSPAVN